MSTLEGSVVQPPWFYSSRKSGRGTPGTAGWGPRFKLPVQGFFPTPNSRPPPHFFHQQKEASFGPFPCGKWQSCSSLLHTVGIPFLYIWLKINLKMFKFSNSRLASFQVALGICSTKPLLALNCWLCLLAVEMHSLPRSRFKRLCVLAATILKSFLSAPRCAKCPKWQPTATLCGRFHY